MAFLNTSRRDFVLASGLGFVGLHFLPSRLSVACNAAESGNLPTASEFESLTRFPRMVQEWLVAQVREAEKRGSALRETLRTKDDATAYVKSCQDRIRQCFGPVPDRTPLNARTTRVIERDLYRIENVIFESRPGYFVTANLYVPKGRKFPLPGVVGTCGHSANGKAQESYQSFAQGLTRMGYVVLIFDPVGQGGTISVFDA